MFTIYTLITVLILGTICSFILAKENKKAAKELLQGTWGAVGFIVFMILLIGCVPLR